MLTKFIFSCVVDADRLDTIYFAEPSLAGSSKYYKWDRLIEIYEKHISRFTVDTPLNILRSDISNRCLKSSQNAVGSYRLTLPTGAGKTLASLRFALHHANRHNLDRIIYVIPYTSIIDQNVKVVKDIFSEELDSDFVLENHSMLEPENDTKENQHLSQNWDSQIIFTTMVQFMESLFGSGTNKARRLHQLANSIIIFDEIQSLPIKTFHLFNNAMNFYKKYANTTAIYCTATQPPLHKHLKEENGILELSKYPDLIELSSADLETFNRNKIISSVDTKWSLDMLANRVAESFEDNNSALVIVNTKRLAADLYKKFKGDEDLNVFHLSTNMCAAHRKVIFDKINNLINLDDAKVLCVSTQLIEAGVDMDFDCVYREVAGMDSIIQAAGRCNRHGKKKLGTVTVFRPDREIPSILDTIAAGAEATCRVFRECKKDDENSVEINTQILETYFKYYYAAQENKMIFPIDNVSEDILNLLTLNSKSIDEYKRINGALPARLFNQAFKQAGQKFKTIETSAQAVIVPFGNEGKALVQKLLGKINKFDLRATLKKAQQYSVNTFDRVFNKLSNEGYIFQTPIEGIYCLSEECYSNEYGLTDEPVNPQEFLAY